MIAVPSAETSCNVKSPGAAANRRNAPDKVTAIRRRAMVVVVGSAVNQISSSFGDQASPYRLAKFPNDFCLAPAVKKDELTAKWKEISESMPGLVTSVQTKVDALTKNHKLLAGAADSLASVKQSWTDASTAFQSGQLSDARAKASAAKAKLTELQTMLGMKPAA